MKSENSKSITRSSEYQNVIFVKKSSNITRLQNQIQDLKFGLLIFEEEGEENIFELFYNSLKIEIHQKIYFLKISSTTTKILYEMYQVNNILIQRKLGKWNRNSNKFQWKNAVNLNGPENLKKPRPKKKKLVKSKHEKIFLTKFHFFAISKIGKNQFSNWKNV